MQAKNKRNARSIQIKRNNRQKIKSLKKQQTQQGTEQTTHDEINEHQTIKSLPNFTTRSRTKQRKPNRLNQKPKPTKYQQTTTTAKSGTNGKQIT